MEMEEINANAESASLKQTLKSSPTEMEVHTAYTRPITLGQGEVSNDYHQLEIPAGPIAVYRFEAEVVEKDADGNYIPVPSYDAYLHHHVVASTHESSAYMKDKHTPMKAQMGNHAIGFGAGTECRGTPQEFFDPYAFVTAEGEDSWIANVHIINTRGMDEKNTGHCLECPCTEDNTPEDLFDPKGSSWDKCNVDLVEEENDSCFPETYKGGLRCCENGQHCLMQDSLDAEADNATYYLRYKIHYSVFASHIRPLYLAGCCDATGNLDKAGAIEYDIEVCNEEKHPGCVHTLSTTQTLDSQGSAVFGAFGNNADETHVDREVDVVYMVGHQHRGGLGITLHDEDDNEICHSTPTYGSGHDAGDEEGYIVAMSTCTFDPPLRMHTSDLIRITALYDNTKAHTGVMSLFYIAMTDVLSDDLAIDVRPYNAEPSFMLARPSSGKASFSSVSIIFVGIAVAVGLLLKKRLNNQYENLPTEYNV
eukprot:CAMPEP_0195512998 /NCGR_PEP_ID=MMETSP0794_2-20130614/4754_1 /TAXON_ID=515487 /ORGANISM="Stephanopyxis turris, Strain CCMP 815" /LENGTH=478 /DNA_ID=CAMNT_0040640901 /DNA_START=108 /DNA_END=1544 /DNA_ORIENTATION=+